MIFQTQELVIGLAVILAVAGLFALSVHNQHYYELYLRMKSVKFDAQSHDTDKEL